MINLNVGDKISSITKKTKHIIESIETIDTTTVVFTEDVKCFPISDVKKEYDSFVAEYFLKVFSGETPSDEDRKKLKIILWGRE